MRKFWKKWTLVEKNCEVFDAWYFLNISHLLNERFLPFFVVLARRNFVQLEFIFSLFARQFSSIFVIGAKKSKAVNGHKKVVHAFCNHVFRALWVCLHRFWGIGRVILAIIEEVRFFYKKSPKFDRRTRDLNARKTFIFVSDFLTPKSEACPKFFCPFKKAYGWVKVPTKLWVPMFSVLTTRNFFQKKNLPS